MGRARHSKRKLHQAQDIPQLQTHCLPSQSDSQNISLTPPLIADSPGSPSAPPFQSRVISTRNIFKQLTDTEWLFLRTLTDNRSNPTILQFGPTPLRQGKLHCLRRRDHQDDHSYWLDDEIISSFLFILPDILTINAPPR